MLGQSKTVFQAEIDAACELIDFWRFNPALRAGAATTSSRCRRSAMWNQLDYRAARGIRLRGDAVQLHVDRRQPADGAGADGQHGDLEAGVERDALGVLPDAAARGGGLAAGRHQLRAGRRGRRSRTCCSRTAISRACTSPAARASSTACGRRSARTCRSTRTYPRIVGETGGKDFIVAHPSADPQALAVAIARGGFEFQGQKCSAASRVYVPRSLWKDVRDRVVAMMEDMRMGDITDFRNFMGAVIDEKAFKKISDYVDDARGNATIIAGGEDRTAARATSSRPTLVADEDPGVPAAVRGDLRPGGDGVRVRRRQVERDARGRSTDVALRAHRRGVRERSRGGARGDRWRCATRPATST